MVTSNHISRRSLLGLAAATAVGAAACGRDDAPSVAVDGPGELDLWVLQDDLQNAVQSGAVARFNATHRARVKMTWYDNDPYRERLRTAMASPNQPDIFFSWGGASLREFVDTDQVVDLTPALDQDPAFKAKWIPSVLESGKIGDRYYGIPNRGMQPVILFYNKKLLKRVGAAEPPKTWSTMMDLVDELNQAGVTPFALAGSQAWTQLMWLEYLVDRLGGPEPFRRVANGDNAAWRDPAFAGAIDKIRELVDRDGFAEDFANIGYDTRGAGTIFAQGRAAMHLMGSWEYPNQVRDYPRFAKEELGYTSFPAVGGGSGDAKAIVGNPTNYFSVTKSSDNVEAAIDFLKEMATDAYVEDYIRRGDVPAVADLEDRLHLAPNPDFAQYVYGMVREASTFQLSWDQAIPDKVARPMLDNLQKVFNKRLDATGFVNAMVNVA